MKTGITVGYARLVTCDYEIYTIYTISPALSPCSFQCIHATECIQYLTCNYIQYLLTLTSVHNCMYINLPVASPPPDKFTGGVVLLAVLLLVPSEKDTYTMSLSGKVS